MKFKTVNNTYLYSVDKDANTKILTDAIIHSDRIDHKDLEGPEFKQVMQYLNAYALTFGIKDIVFNPSVHLIYTNKLLPIVYRVFTARDIIEHTKPLSVFVSVNDIIKEKGGIYTVDNTNKVFIAQILDAYIRINITRNVGVRFLNNTMIEHLLQAYTKLFLGVFGYLNILKTIDIDTLKCFIGHFFMVNLLGYDVKDAKMMVIKTLDIPSVVYDTLYKLDMLNNELFNNLSTFVSGIKEYMKLDKEFTLLTLTKTWVWLYGTGTYFGLELIESFSAMLTNAYLGSYLNNQNSINKNCLSHINVYIKEILKK